MVSEAPILPLTRHRGPHIVISQGTLVVTAITGTTEATGTHVHGLPSDGDLFAWRSSDGGKTWSHGVRVNDVLAGPREGLHTLASDGRGNLFTAWLDNRKLDNQKDGTRLYGAWSKDSGLTWSKNELLYASPDGTICQCCHPSAIFTDTGELELMWRNALGGSRDMYLIRAPLNQHFGQPEKLGEGTWKLNACPMDGGGIARANGKTITAWRRADEIFMAQPGQPETKLGDGKDVALAASHGQIYAAWIKGAQLIVWNAGKAVTVADQAAYQPVAKPRLFERQPDER
jgi:hypothetical protein